MISNRIFLSSAFLLCLLGMVAGGALAQKQPAEKTYPILSACEKSETVFPPSRYLPLFDPIDRIARDYHTTVDRIIEAHEKKRVITCSEGIWEEPTKELTELATTLAPWSDAGDYFGLVETDIGAVLLEYLRMYECALQDERYFATIRVAEEKRQGDVINTFLFTSGIADRLKRIRTEQYFARRALNRTLILIGGVDRLRPVDSSLECLQRASLDIRNTLGLAADVSSCIPRVLDARGSLRTLDE